MMTTINMADPAQIEYCLAGIKTACMTRGEWASWVGAIGTVAAVIGAACIASLQMRAERLRIREASAGTLSAFAELLSRLGDDLAVTHLQREADQGAPALQLILEGFKEHQMSHFEGLVAELNGYPVDSTTSESILLALLEIRPLIREALAHLRRNEPVQFFRTMDVATGQMREHRHTVETHARLLRLR